MFRVDHSSATATMPTPSQISSPGFFTEGNEAGGVPATVVTADWANMVQEELINVVQAGGQTPAKGQFNQLLLAIQALIIQGQSSSIGQVSHFAVKTPPAGWLKCNGLTIGKPGSGATARANDDVFSLYEALWWDWSNAVLTIQTASGLATVRGASPQADWDSLKRLPLPEVRGEGFRAWDDGRGVDSNREFGSWQADQNQSHSHAAYSSGAGAHGHSGRASGAGSHSHAASSGAAGGHAHSAWTDTQGAHTHSVKEGGVQPQWPGGETLASGDDYTQAVGYYSTTSSAGAHGHNVGVSGASDHTHAIMVGADGAHEHSLAVDAVGDHAHSVTVGWSGGGESRMRNVALAAFIRYR